jgi:hypothetical protein
MITDHLPTTYETRLSVDALFLCVFLVVMPGPARDVRLSWRGATLFATPEHR